MLLFSRLEGGEDGEQRRTAREESHAFDHAASPPGRQDIRSDQSACSFFMGKGPAPVSAHIQPANQARSPPLFLPSGFVSFKKSCAVFWMCRPAAAVLAVLTACLCRAPLRCAAARSPQLNNRPVIGVLAQENLPGDQFARGSSYIAASYVKYLEGAGSRVVPIRINRTEEEYAKIFYSINGLLLPGGDVNIQTSQFSRAAKIFYDLALKANDAGDYFPIWGTCQGFQQLSVLTANKNLLTLTDTKAVALPLTLTPAAQSSRLFRSFPKDLLQSLAGENITSNFHSWSLSMQNYSRNAKLKRFYKVLSTNNDGKKEFISTMEAYRYPFYAVQWHPEKSPFEWIDKPGMVHSTSAIRACFYTASFFVSEAMKNQHHFSSPVEEERALIYNFSPVYRGIHAVFVQNYYFD